MTVLFFLIASVVFGGVSYKLRWLTRNGSITASAFGFSLLWLGGWAWVVPLMIFFASSSLLSKIGNTSRKEEKRREDIRSATQVLANGGVAWCMLIIYALTTDLMWYAGFVGCMAAANADTWATEIGRLAGGQPRSILTGHILGKGLSGGITWQGTSGSVAGALLVGIGCYPFFAYPLYYWIILGFFAGMTGSLLDSVLGAAFQAKYRDKASGTIVESFDAHAPADKVSGFSWMTNDLVNVGCTLSGGAIAIGLYQQIFAG